MREINLFFFTFDALKVKNRILTFFLMGKVGRTSKIRQIGRR